jgi:hypothetical protein
MEANKRLAKAFAKKTLWGRRKALPNHFNPN